MIRAFALAEGHLEGIPDLRRIDATIGKNGAS